MKGNEASGSNMETMNVKEALRDYPDHQAGWWTSAEGEYDMNGATVAEAVAELVRVFGDDSEDVLAGSIEVKVDA